MIVQNIIAITFPILLSEKIMRGVKTYKTIIFIPVTLAILVTGYLWKPILNPQWEVIVRSL